MLRRVMHACNYGYVANRTAAHHPFLTTYILLSERPLNNCDRKDAQRLSKIYPEVKFCTVESGWDNFLFATTFLRLH